MRSRAAGRAGLGHRQDPERLARHQERRGRVVALVMSRGLNGLGRGGMTRLRRDGAGEREADEVEAPVACAGDVPIEDPRDGVTGDEAVAMMEVTVHDGACGSAPRPPCREARRPAARRSHSAAARARAIQRSAASRASSSHARTAPASTLCSRARPISCCAEGSSSTSGTRPGSTSCNDQDTSPSVPVPT